MSFKPSDVHLIEVENIRDLVATLKDEELGLRTDRINLNKYLGYYDGAFKWDRKGFSEYCESLFFRWEGEVPTLQAVMRRRENDVKGRAPWDRDPWDMISVNLAERITILNGRFEVQSNQSGLNFSVDAEEISLKDKHILCAVLKDDEGDKRSSTLDLDEYIGNDDGEFKWDGKGFSKSAEYVSFSIKDGLPILYAKLVNERQEAYGTTLNLAERIRNNNGQLERWSYPRSFLLDATRVQVVQVSGRYVLRAEGIKNNDGWERNSELDLTKCLSRGADGQLRWSRIGGSGVVNLHLRFEGEAKVPTLHGELQDNDGYWQDVSINAECIINNNGKLEVRYD